MARRNAKPLADQGLEDKAQARMRFKVREGAEAVLGTAGGRLFVEWLMRVTCVTGVPPTGNTTQTHVFIGRQGVGAELQALIDEVDEMKTLQMRREYDALLRVYRDEAEGEGPGGKPGAPVSDWTTEHP